MTGHPSGGTAASLTIEPFVGHRVWRLIPSGGEPVLASATSGDPWLTREIRAECHAGTLLIPRERRPASERHPGARPPAMGCTCGIYAAKEPRLPPHRRVWAAGQVRLWGRVIEGTTGFRAECARIEGDVEVLLGMGPGVVRCTMPPCRRHAVGIWTGSRSFLSRCSLHGRETLMPFLAFEAWVDAVFRDRYGIGARLAER